MYLPDNIELLLIGGPPIASTTIQEACSSLPTQRRITKKTQLEDYCSDALMLSAEDLALNLQQHFPRSNLSWPVHLKSDDCDGKGRRRVKVNLLKTKIIQLMRLKSNSSFAILIRHCWIGIGFFVSQCQLDLNSLLCSLLSTQSVYINAASLRISNRIPSSRYSVLFSSHAVASALLTWLSHAIQDALLIPSSEFAVCARPTRCSFGMVSRPEKEACAR